MEGHTLNGSATVLNISLVFSAYLSMGFLSSIMPPFYACVMRVCAVDRPILIFTLYSGYDCSMLQDARMQHPLV
jgi:hypothetical protein